MYNCLIFNGASYCCIYVHPFHLLHTESSLDISMLPNDDENYNYKSYTTPYPFQCITMRLIFEYLTESSLSQDVDISMFPNDDKNYNKSILQFYISVSICSNASYMCICYRILPISGYGHQYVPQRRRKRARQSRSRSLHSARARLRQICRHVVYER